MPQRFREELPKLLPEVDAFMGVDQVAKVPEIVAQALAARKRKLSETPGAASGKNRKKKIATTLNQQAETTSHASHGTEESLRGTEKFNRTRQVIAPVAAGPIVEVNQRPQFIQDFATPRFRLTPRHFAYVKIAEGCNHPCSFCTIPRMRGSHRSRQQLDVVEECRLLLQDGVKELNLISQDSTYYGLDLRPERTGSIASPEKFKAAAKALPADSTTLCTLIRDLDQLPGDFWIRLLYTHPAHWTDELIQTIASSRKVARYIDMPLQHINSNMLERMRRETGREYIVDLIRRIRAGIPGIAIRTTFIVGFPGETEAYFQELLQFIEDTRFERLGVFTYSQEEGTRASKMEKQVPDKIKQKRREMAMAAQLKISRELGAAQVRKTIRVLVEKQASASELTQSNVSSWEHGLIRQEAKKGLPLRKGRYFICRGEADAPDIDGRVYLRGNAEPGQFASVRIVGHTDYDLVAELV
jgi:ribosomal protein S12 methylthiotransferase